ncbi:MAG: hypothetical protein JXR37_36435 [Kiritimatiellae bacterium]|nr:hypothetical protein [Kiritimatiellia bacterium]
MARTPRTPMSLTPPPNDEPERQKRGKAGCIWGCLIVATIVLVTLAAAFMLVRYVKGYISDQPAAVPVVKLSPAKMADLDRRLAAFRQAIADDKSARLLLSRDDINAKISSSGMLRAGSKAYVSIEGEQLSAQISLPLDRFRIPGQYLNGQAKIHVSLDEGSLIVRAEEVLVHGKPLPDRLAKAVQEWNLAAVMMEDAEFTNALAKIAKITVRDGKVLVER